MSKGSRIKNRREEIGISQTDLAKSIGVSKQNLYKYENDIISNIPSDIIEMIASVLQCSPEYLMGWTQDPNPSEEEHDPNKTEKALQLYDLYQKAIPEVQKTVSILLKFPFP